MIRIISTGTDDPKEAAFKTRCSNCGCVFQYNYVDVQCDREGYYVVCPTDWCKHFVSHTTGRRVYPAAGLTRDKYLADDFTIVRLENELSDTRIKLVKAIEDCDRMIKESSGKDTVIELYEGQLAEFRDRCEHLFQRNKELSTLLSKIYEECKDVRIEATVLRDLLLHIPALVK